MGYISKCLVAGLLLCVVFISGVSPAGSLKEAWLKNGPYLMHTTTTSQVIMWETRTECSGEVVHGLDGRSLDNSADGGRGRIHEATLTGLEPETKYFYQVRGKCGGLEFESEVYTFQTAVKPKSAYSFVVMGDNRTLFWNFKKIAAAAFAERPNFAVNVGDVVTTGRRKYQWKLEFFKPAAKLMRFVPTYIAIGNHEGDAEWYYRYVSYPEPENYYSFDYGNSHWTIVDSNQPLSPGEEQFKWVEKDLASSSARWKFVAHHHPPYSSDENDYGDTRIEESDLGDLNARSLVPLYEKYGVDVVWVGHIHDYERTWPLKGGEVVEDGGVIYIQTGGGGAPLEDFAPTHSWYTAKVFRGWQFCYAAINGGEFTMMAYDIDGRMFDYLEIKK